MHHVLSPSERQFVEDGVKYDCRGDGRDRAAYRPVSITTGVLQQANGSARVRLSGRSSLTEVVAAVKVRARAGIAPRRCRLERRWVIVLGIQRCCEIGLAILLSRAAASCDALSCCGVIASPTQPHCRRQYPLTLPPLLSPPLHQAEVCAPDPSRPAEGQVVVCVQCSSVEDRRAAELLDAELTEMLNRCVFSTCTCFAPALFALFTPPFRALACARLHCQGCGMWSVVPASGCDAGGCHTGEYCAIALRCVRWCRLSINTRSHTSRASGSIVALHPPLERLPEHCVHPPSFSHTSPSTIPPLPTERFVHAVHSILKACALCPAGTAGQSTSTFT